MYYVYLLHSTKDNGFYIGFSTDLKRRLSEPRKRLRLTRLSRKAYQQDVTTPHQSAA